MFIFEKSSDENCPQHYQGTLKESWLSEGILEDILKSYEAIHLIVIDSYLALDYHYKIALKYAKKLAIIDDFNRLDYPKEALILNPAINSHKIYSGRSNVYAGLGFNFCKKQKSIKEVSKNIVVCTGGGDEFNVTQEIANFLEILKLDFSVTIILGKYYNHDLKTKFKVLRNIPKEQLLELFLHSSLGILGGGVILNEALSCALPALVFEMAPNQAFQINEFHKLGAIIKMQKISDLELLYNCDITRMKKIASDLDFGSNLDGFLRDLI